MRDIQYREFSLAAHRKNWGANKPNTCQLELTFRCGLHCRHCYSDCYNRPEYIAKELGTKEIKFILDKVYDSGAIWLCLTGGDPLTRADFLEIYRYAKRKGFIIGIFTNGYSMTEEAADYLKKSPPYVIEITLNAVTKKTFEEISGVEDSFEKAMSGINMILERKLPLKIKTQVSKQNLGELEKIKTFVENLGLKFRPNALLNARLDGDTTPCSLRIDAGEFLKLNGGFDPAEADVCRDYTGPKTGENKLFRCAVDSKDGYYIDPYGNMLTCLTMRKNTVNILEKGIPQARTEISAKIRRQFKTDSKCRYCNLIDLCMLCPGRALLEAGDMEAPIEYFCEVASLGAGAVR